MENGKDEIKAIEFLKDRGYKDGTIQKLKEGGWILVYNKTHDEEGTHEFFKLRKEYERGIVGEIYLKFVNMTVVVFREFKTNIHGYDISAELNYKDVAFDIAEAKKKSDEVADIYNKLMRFCIEE